MAKLVFNGHTHQIKLISDAGETVGKWVAYNNVDSRATLTHIQNGAYPVTDRRLPHRHTADANGAYGLHGIIRFAVPGHSGIGVHSGRAAARHTPGPALATMGCIRTSDEAMQAIAVVMGRNPLTTIEVVANSAPSARAASHRHRSRRLHGRHHG